MAFNTIEVVLASAVANAATTTVSYPAGTNQAAFTGINAVTTGGLAIVNNNEVYTQDQAGSPAARTVAFSFGGSNVTVTNNSGVTWPAGARVLFQFNRAGADRPGFEPAPAITSLTDNSAGTASDTLAAIGGTYSQAEVRNSVASMAQKINQILIALRSNGFIRS